MTLLKRSPLLVFFVLAYLIAWSTNLVQAGLLPFQLPLPLLDFLVNWAPGFAALIVATAIGGLGGVRTLLRPLLMWRVGLGWYSVALLLPPLLVLAAIGLSVLLGGPLPQFSHTFGPQLALLPILLLFYPDLTWWLLLTLTVLLITGMSRGVLTFLVLRRNKAVSVKVATPPSPPSLSLT